MVDFLVRHTLLNPSQYGFPKARSCLTNMLFFFKKSPVGVIYFQKTFYKLPHQRLLLKLKTYGTADGIIDWIKQWLTDRRLHVVVNGEVSNRK